MSSNDPADTPQRGGFSGLSEGLPRRFGFGGISPDPDDTGLVSPLSAGDLPNRYEIRDRDEGRALVCREAPGVFVQIDRRFSFTEPEARKLGERTILLDGAGVFGPLVDDAGHLYNLDHHEGCLRAFTLATCEQALILVLKGLELDRGDWSVYANEPDLDTAFALWVVLNYRRVRELDVETRDRILPLLRLEGAIDANGFEIAESCGLPQTWVRSQKAALDELHAAEQEARRRGAWDDPDSLGEYVRDTLLAIDRLVYRPSDFSDYDSVEQEYGHVEIGQGKVAVVCRDPGGIYDVEKRLKKVWGDRMGLIVLEKEPSHYTLRRTATLAGIDLDDAYEKLNLLDPAVDGRPPGKRWGGSDDIGGSPRPTGTGLTPREIGKILKLTYKRVRPVQHLQRFLTAALWALVLVLAAGVGVTVSRFSGHSSATPRGEILEMALAAAIAGVGAWLLTRQVSRGWIWLYGWRRPAGKSWLWAVPVVLLGAAAGGAWIPPSDVQDPELLGILVGALFLTSIGLELIFRGLVHGLLILDHPVQSPGGRWFLSKPNLAAAFLYALLTLGASLFWIAALPWTLPVEGLAAVAIFATALVTALGLGAIRERSLSVWPGVAVLFLGQIARLAVDWWRLG